MSNIPEGATHQWVPDDYYYNPFVIRLKYYRIQEDGDAWMVYSDLTGWRFSSNSPEWFEEETKLGYFKEINV